MFKDWGWKDLNHCGYPPFSPNWCFSFEGKLVIKGATKVLYEKIDDKLIQRLRHQPKQGVLQHMVYRYPPLANHTWTYWRNLEQNKNVRDTIPIQIPKNWKKNEHICNEVVLACPFCNSYESSNGIRKGNLKHLHLFCPSMHLKKARTECNQKIESALYAIYDFAAM